MKLAQEIGAGKAAHELGIPSDTLYGWQKAVVGEVAGAGHGSHMPGLAEELAVLRKQVKVQEKEIRRLKNENEFLEETSAFSPQAVGSQQRTAKEVYREKTDGGEKKGKLSLYCRVLGVGAFTGIWRTHVGNPQ